MPKHAQTSENRPDTRAINYAVKYMEKELANPELSLEDIADAVGYHPNYFIQEFKQVMRITPMKYVARLRLERALYLLRSTKDPIQTICLKTGIKKSSSLSSKMKKVVGMTPVQYRRLHKLNELREQVTDSPDKSHATKEEK
jgi:AraC-like DNA-binding protein